MRFEEFLTRLLVYNSLLRKPNPLASFLNRPPQELNLSQYLPKLGSRVGG
jgi:hypothetical protein